MNGTKWLPAHTAILERMAGRPDAEIAKATGHALITIRKRREAMGVKAYVGRPRPAWSRRDFLLNSAAGLDFQISL
jgi:hypothetical protein